MPELNQHLVLARNSDAMGRISGPHHRSPPVAGDHAILRPRARSTPGSPVVGRWRRQLDNQKLNKQHP